MAVNYMLMGFAESLLVLFIGRFISGIGASTMSTCNAYVADVTPEDKRAQNFGLIGAAFGMGFVFTFLTLLVIATKSAFSCCGRYLTA